MSGGFPVTPWTNALAKKIATLGSGPVTALLWGTILVSIAIAVFGTFWIKALWTAFLLAP